MVPFFMDRQKTYLLANAEVKLTGRCAKKEKTKSSGTTVTEIYYEVEPVDESVGSWKKWTTSSELIEITTMDDK